MGLSKSVSFINGAVGIRLRKNYWSILVPPGQILPLRNESVFTGTLPGQQEFLFHICFLETDLKGTQKEITRENISAKPVWNNQRQYTVISTIDSVGSFCVKIEEHETGNVCVDRLLCSLPVISSKDLSLRRLVYMRNRYLSAIDADEEILRQGNFIHKNGTLKDLNHFLLMTEGYVFPSENRGVDMKGMKYAS